MSIRRSESRNRKRSRYFIGWFFSTVLLFGAPPYVLLVSFDGFRADYLDWYPTPQFHQVAEAGVRADGLIPVFVTKTFPNHYSIATGMYVENHGLIGNRFFAPDLNAMYQISDRTTVEDAKFYGGEPIWVTAERQGIRTASYFWVGSEAPIGGIQPSIWKRYHKSDPFEARIDSVARWFQLPPERRPHLVLLYFHEPDETGHNYGPRSPEAKAEVQDLDRVLGLLVKRMHSLTIADSLNLILVSDHGMAAIDPARQIHLDQEIDLSGFRIEGSNPYAFIYGGSRKQIDNLIRQLKGVDHITFYRKEDIPDRWHFRENERIKQVLVVADEGWSLFWDPNKSLTRHGGTHGFDNALRSMEGIFIADGPAFKDGYRRSHLENVDIYPLIAYLLGLKPYPGIDGKLARVQDVLKREPLKGKEADSDRKIKSR